MSASRRLQFGLQQAGNLWTPQNDSAELRGWWRADISSTIITSGSTITTWNNLIDNTLWSMQSDNGAATPDTGATVNSIPVTTFANPQRLVCSKNTTPDNDGMFTFIALIDSPIVNQSDDSIFTVEDNSGNRIGVAANDALNFMGATKVGNDLSNTGFIFTGGPYTGTNICVLDMDFNTGTIRARMNGTEVGTNSNYSLKIGNKILCKFMCNSNGNRQLAGNLGDFIIAKFENGYFGENGSKIFIEQTEGYLAWRYGMESKLPFNHPYRDGPPREGEPIPPAIFDPPPTSADSSVNATAPDAYTFTESDFPYSDFNGQPMAHVSIETLPGTHPDGFPYGTFELSGVAVTLGQNIDTADINNLVFTPTAGLFGAPLTTFNFSVNDGNQDSLAYTMSININSPSN